MRKWRVGSLSSGLLLILLGTLLLASTFGKLPFLDTLIKYWPIILILLGVEVLAYQFLKKEGKVQYDGVSILIIFVIAVVSIVLIPFHAFHLSDAFTPMKSKTIAKDYNLPKTIKKLRINIPEGDLILRGQSTNDIHVDGTYPTPTDSPSNQELLEWSVKGDIATLRIRSSQKGVRSLFFDKKPQVSIDLPQSLALDIEAKSADLEGRNLKAATTIRQSMGDLSLKQMDGNLTVDHDMGDVRLNDIKGSIKVENVSGQIRVDHCMGPLDLKNTNGDVTIYASKLKGDWMTYTENGNIMLFLTEPTDATIHGNVSSGELTGNVKWKNDQLTLGSGKHAIQLSTTNGEIRVDTPHP
ncbi:DUF4097 family beta strand repeat-containing protein [Marininema halotolerans]|uniref:Putative adhesin n=1 Tax=Marininema halotolerans TaxID=1155944 RepID=A0A1I6SFW0_9BACL|nr:DUF4097 family beta strand repeat-containing protein [Marininema halotolerans]SFS75618.1 Putative adhesin [Marininema halotolerans]